MRLFLNLSYMDWELVWFESLITTVSDGSDLIKVRELTWHLTVTNIGMVEDRNLIMKVLDTDQSIQQLTGGIKDININQRVNIGI